MDCPTPTLVAIDSSFVRSTGPAMPDLDGQRDPAAADPLEPAGHGRGVEAEVADDVGGVGPLVPHGLHGDVVVDRGVALGVAGDADRRANGLPSRLSAGRAGRAAS